MSLPAYEHRVLNSNRRIRKFENPRLTFRNPFHSHSAHLLFHLTARDHGLWSIEIHPSARAEIHHGKSLCPAVSLCISFSSFLRSGPLHGLSCQPCRFCQRDAASILLIILWQVSADGNATGQPQTGNPPVSFNDRWGMILDSAAGPALNTPVMDNLWSKKQDCLTSGCLRHFCTELSLISQDLQVKPMQIAIFLLKRAMILHKGVVQGGMMSYSLLAFKSRITAQTLSAAMELPPHQHGSNPLLLRFMHSVSSPVVSQPHSASSPPSPNGKDSTSLRPRMDFRSLMFCHCLFKVPFLTTAKFILLSTFRICVSCIVCASHRPVTHEHAKTVSAHPIHSPTFPNSRCTALEAHDASILCRTLCRWPRK